MKRLIATFLTVLAAATVHAGSFGGPTSLNTSTETGAVGTYQGTLRGNSLSGVLRFAYNSSGNPTSITGNVTTWTSNPSTYVIFIDGMVFTGVVDASIQSSKIASVLENGVVNDPSGNVSPLFLYYEVPGGFWNAKINTSSANYFFKGKGSVAINSKETSTDPWNVSNRKFKINGQRTSTTE